MCSAAILGAAPAAASVAPVTTAELIGVEATFVVDEPPRASTLALWSPDGKVVGADDELVVVLAAGRRVRRRTVAVRSVPIGAAVDALVALAADAPVTASVRAWAAAARVAVELVARGRLLPSITADGDDAWRLGPFDPDDLWRQHQLAAALPAEAYATLADPGPPLRVPSPGVSARRFGDAVADAVVRTAAAPLAGGGEAFAAGRASRVDVAGEWLASVGGDAPRTTVTLRLEPPADDEADDTDRATDDPGPADEPDPAEDRFTAGLVLQSAEDPSLAVTAAELWDAPDAVLTRFDDAEDTLLLTLRRAARVWPPVGRLLDAARPERLVLADREVDDLLGPVADDLAGAGLSVQWPAELLKPLELRPRISTPRPEAVAGAGLSADALLSWQARLDGVELTEDELAQLAEAKRAVVRLRGRWVRADPARLARLRDRRRLGAGAALGVALGGTLAIDGETVDAEVEGPLAELGDRLRALDGGHERAEPPGLAAELRPYQRRGLAWLAEMADLGLGGVLADDMGLGKTLQVLALHLDRHAERESPRRATLVVCPTTLVANWEREARRFAPDVPVRRYHGSGRSLDDLAGDELVVTTYGVVRRDASLAEVGWGLVVADEAQAVKNPHSRGAKALRNVAADARFALTGTPVENQLIDLWAICDWTTPGLLGPLERFRRDVAIPVERRRDPDASAWLATLVRPFVLRRRKSDPTIVPDLPPKTETDRVVDLTAEQATLYRAVVDDALERIRATDGIERRGLVLALLTALKQICNHPAHHLGQDGPLPGRSAKLDATVDLLEITSGEGDAALVFTQYVEMGRLLERRLAAAGLRVGFLHGGLSSARRQELVDRFQAGGLDVFVLSLKAGGTGLNLTRATHVVHYDRWWNPAVEDQASDRAWRIGQDRPVQVHRLICEGTVEDRIATLLTSKRELADRVVGGGEGWVSELTDDELADLVALSDGDGDGDGAAERVEPAGSGSGG
ncbi:MAG: DEAD/DEAH box helicase [Actinomycetota bacterium]|nr:DEAD/DEAH box helicase [Actinomycetota bacterium]